MAITNGYATLAQLKSSLTITDTSDDALLELAITSTSRMIDDFTGRFFYANGTVNSPVIRYYTPLDPWSLAVDDYVSISAIATDDNFNQTWSTVINRT